MNLESKIGIFVIVSLGLILLVIFGDYIIDKYCEKIVSFNKKYNIKIKIK